MDELPIDEENVLHFALRYALGRMSAAPSIVVDEIERKWPRIRKGTRDQLKREVAEAIRTNSAGHACDVATWRRIENLP